MRAFHRHHRNRLRDFHPLTRRPVQPPGRADRVMVGEPDEPGMLEEASFPALPQAPERTDNAGHRQRVRERFLKLGGDAFEDYELLELALQLAVPRRDTKKLA